MKKALLNLLFAFLLHASAQAQMQTLALTNFVAGYQVTNGSGNFYASGYLNVPTNGFATLKSILPFYGNYGPILEITTQGASVIVYPWIPYTPPVLQPVAVAGPATIRILHALPVATLATFDVQPSAFPPNKTLTVGAYSGNVQVTMQMSTDLVNWTPAVNAQIYTNSPDARFFRIQLVTNAGP